MAEQYPTRLRILRKLTDIIREVTPANGYVNDLGPGPGWPNGRVFRGRAVFGQESPLPMVTILEVPMPPDQVPSPPDSADRVGEWDLIIQGFVEDDFENPTDPAQVLLADVVRRLALEKKNGMDREGNCKFLGMGDIVTGMQIGVGVVRPPDAEVSDKAYFWLQLRLTVAESLDKPYD